MASQQYCVEQFAAVRGHQSFSLNFHLQSALIEFDKGYRKYTYPWERGNFAAAREVFAHDVSQCLAKIYRADDGLQLKVETTTNFRTAAGTHVGVRVKSEFSDAARHKIQQYQRGWSPQRP